MSGLIPEQQPQLCSYLRTDKETDRFENEKEKDADRQRIKESKKEIQKRQRE